MEVGATLYPRVTLRDIYIKAFQAFCPTSTILTKEPRKGSMSLTTGATGEMRPMKEGECSRRSATDEARLHTAPRYTTAAAAS